MTNKAISPVRRRLIEDMTIRRLSPKTHYQYIRHVKKFADFLGRSADKATAQDVHRYQLWLASSGTSVGTANVSATALRFFFKVTLKRHDLAEELISTREPRRLPVVLSPEEVGRLLAAATNIKHRAILSLAYATGLRASEVVSLKALLRHPCSWSKSPIFGPARSTFCGRCPASARPSLRPGALTPLPTVCFWKG